MRDIKFRCWFAGMMHYGIPAISFNKDGVVGVSLNMDADDFCATPDTWTGKDDYSIMQYTGRKDKNDREVFEGDIYRIEEETDGLDEVFYVVVIWIDEWSMFASVLLEEYHRYKVGGAKELDEQLFWTYTLNDINSPKHFYCGNIYQNPDLLQC